MITEKNKSNEAVTVAKELNTLLADYHLYYQKLRNFHWNVKGQNFFDLHNKFEEMYNDSKIKIDEIAERILTLRFHPVSNLSDYLENSSLRESASNLRDDQMMTALIKDNELLLLQMRKTIDLANNVKDEGTVDLLSSYIAQLEKNTWMLEAWSSNQPS